MHLVRYKPGKYTSKPMPPPSLSPQSFLSPSDATCALSPKCHPSKCHPSKRQQVVLLRKHECERAPTCDACQFPWCNFSVQGQAKMPMRLHRVQSWEMAESLSPLSKSRLPHTSPHTLCWWAFHHLLETMVIPTAVWGRSVSEIVTTESKIFIQESREKVSNLKRNGLRVQIICVGGKNYFNPFGKHVGII